MSELGVVTAVEAQDVGAPGRTPLVLVRPGVTACEVGTPEQPPAVPVLRVAVLGATPSEPALAPVVRLADRARRTGRR